MTMNAGIIDCIGITRKYLPDTARVVFQLLILRKLDWEVATNPPDCKFTPLQNSPIFQASPVYIVNYV